MVSSDERPARGAPTPSNLIPFPRPPRLLERVGQAIRMYQQGKLRAGAMRAPNRAGQAQAAGAPQPATL